MLVRSILLRGFDRECAGRVGSHLESQAGASASPPRPRSTPSGHRHTSQHHHQPKTHTLSRHRRQDPHGGAPRGGGKGGGRPPPRPLLDGGLGRLRHGALRARALPGPDRAQRGRDRARHGRGLRQAALPARADLGPARVRGGRRGAGDAGAHARGHPGGRAARAPVRVCMCVVLGLPPSHPSHHTNPTATQALRRRGGADGLLARGHHGLHAARVRLCGPQRGAGHG